MKTEHTPGDLVFAYGSLYRADTLHDESSIRIALMDRNEQHTTPCERDANAERLARCWNTHDALVEALRACVAVICEPMCPHEQIGAALDKARSAIKRAVEAKL